MSAKQIPPPPRSKDFFKINPFSPSYLVLHKIEGKCVRDQTDYRMNRKTVTAKAAQLKPYLNA